MRIGQLAMAAGLSVSTLRYYERLGLLPPPPRRGGKRWYDAAGLRRARMLKTGRDAGLRIADLVNLTGNGNDIAARQAILQERGRLIDGQIGRLQQMRELLTIGAACACADLAACGVYKSAQ